MLFGRRFDSAQVHKNIKPWKKNLSNSQELMAFLAHKKGFVGQTEDIIIF